MTLNMLINPYPAGTESDQSLPLVSRSNLSCTHVQSQAGLHTCAVRKGSILMANHLQALVLIFLKLIMESSKNGRWIISLQKFSRLRIKAPVWSEEFQLYWTNLTYECQRYHKYLSRSCDYYIQTNYLSTELYFFQHTTVI